VGSTRGGISVPKNLEEEMLVAICKHVGLGYKSRVVKNFATYFVRSKWPWPCVCSGHCLIKRRYIHMYLEPILRLLSLQLQRQRCYRLERVFVRSRRNIMFLKTK
jgi:hypothetical protein